MRNLAVIGLVLAVVSLGATPVASEAQAADKIVIEGSTTVGPIAKAFATYYMQNNEGVNVTVSETGSGTGAKALINNACDVAAMSRPMKEKEFKAATYGGVMPCPHVVAMDGIAIVVHPSNPLTELKMEQVQAIYEGKITNWKELGGPDKKIVMCSRRTDSGTYETFYKLVMKKAKIDAGAEKHTSNAGVKARVQKTPAAIGYVGLGFVDRKVKALRINGVMPSKATIRSGRYPIARPLYMYTNGYPRLGSHVHAFVTLHLSRKGQEIVNDIGFVPVTTY
jgi:phosphate transport system substrate-binding protein